MNTPVYLKTTPNMEWPDDKFFYLVAREGIFICRNHAFFESCTRLKEGPKELESQQKFLRLKYPKLPQPLVERAVGFFRRVAEKQNSEAAAIWVWNRTTREVELIIPDQKAINGAPSQWSPKGYPQDVKYELPLLAPNQVYMGDIHCHVDGGAYASMTDEHDEEHRPGIHIVVGHINEEPPTFYCDAVVDGERFGVDDLGLVWEGYDKMDTAGVPNEWLDKVKLEQQKPWTSGYTYQGTGGYSSSYSYSDKPNGEDRKIIARLLNGFLKNGIRPTVAQVQSDLFRYTRAASHHYCEKRAEQFIKSWDKAKEAYEKKAA